ncbi:MFS transporter [Pullulanibacillus pueri]|nr:MFS transporter [Pullulanibacillus pueri]
MVLPGIALIGISYAFARFSFGLFLPEISQTFKLTEACSGFIGSLGYFAYCMALLTSSLMIERAGQHVAIRLSALFALLGIVGIAVSSNAFVLGVSVFVAGLSTGWASPAFGTVTANELKPSEQDRGNTWINSGTSFGIILSGPIALFFMEYWRISYAVFALITVVVLIWNAKVIPARKQKATPVSFRELLTLWKRSIPLILASLLIGISSSIYWTFSRSFLVVNYNVPNTEATCFWIVMGAFGIVGGLAGGIIHRIGMQWSYWVGVLLMAGAVALLTLPILAISFLSAILFGMTYIFLTGVFIVWGTSLFSDNPSVGISLSFLLLGIGQFIGASLAGGLIQMSSYTTAFLIFSLIGVLGVFIRTIKQRESLSE